MHQSQRSHYVFILILFNNRVRSCLNKAGSFSAPRQPLGNISPLLEMRSRIIETVHICLRLPTTGPACALLSTCTSIGFLWACPTRSSSSSYNFGTPYTSNRTGAHISDCHQNLVWRRQVFKKEDESSSFPVWDSATSLATELSQIYS